MMLKRTAYIRSVGRFLPERRLTNHDLEKMVDTSDEWIVTRTGIRERRILQPGLGNSHMAVPAAMECLDRAGVSPGEIDAILVGTVTPDMIFPATACLVARDIGAKNAWGFDLSAGCSGFLYSLSVAAQMIESGRVNKILVVGSDVMSTIIDYTTGIPASFSETAPAPCFSIRARKRDTASWISYCTPTGQGSPTCT